MLKWMPSWRKVSQEIELKKLSSYVVVVSVVIIVSIIIMISREEEKVRCRGNDV